MRIKRYSCFIMVSIIVTGLLPITSYAATGQELVNYANGITGTYDGSSSGRKGPNTFDCSGFVWYCCNAVGINISSGNTDSQKKYGAFVDCSSLKSNNNHSNLQIGDLIFFDYGGDGITDHVGIYSGNGKIRHCWSQGVVTTSLTSNFYSGDSRTLYSVVDSVRRIVSSGGSSTSTPGQPILKNMKATYTNEEEILFSWDKTVNTTSYNWYIDKYDASSAGYKGDHYVRLGHEDNVEFVRKTLPIGKYRVCVTSYNTNYYKDSEWIYFEVIDEKPFTKTFVTKNDYGYIVETVMYNLDENCEVIVVGYNDNRFITLKPAIQQEQSASCTLVGDIDEIKVMAWESIGNIKPLCDAVVVPQSEWIIE